MGLVSGINWSIIIIDSRRLYSGRSWFRGRLGEVIGSGARRGGGDLVCALTVRLLAGFNDAEVAVMKEELAAFKKGVGSTRRNR